jgi:AcrR family transcriptional regulator
MSETVRRLSPERRARILDAARHLILRQGLRATTMEAVAREAKIAKPTLYGYFTDKEAVFAAIIETLIQEIRTAFGKAFQSESDVVARIGTGLATKYKIISRLLEGSPHAGELYSEHDRSAAEQFTALEAEIETSITTALRQAGVARPRPLAQLVLASAYGIGCKAGTPAEIGPAIRLMVERLVGPELRP